MTGATTGLASHLADLAPELLLAAAGAAILLLDRAAGPARRLCAPLAATAVVAAAAVSISWLPHGPSFGGRLETTVVTIFAGLAVLVAAALAVMVSPAYFRRAGSSAGRYQALVLWAAAGGLLVVRSTDLLTMFLAFELMSLCLCVLAGLHRRLAVATEAALKDLLSGGLASAFALFGIAILFGEAGDTRLDAIGRTMAAGGSSPHLVALGALMVVAALGYRISLVPFHGASPDVQQGTPTPIAVLSSVAPKVAGAVVLARLFDVAMEGGLADGWGAVVALLAVLSMALGNLLALVQRDLKRMLAYAGIAHMGYLLLPLVEGGAGTWTAILPQLLAWTLAGGGAFAVASMLYGRPGEQHLIAELSGWGYRQPLPALCLSVCLVSLAGLPPTLGFVARTLLLLESITQGHLGLAIAAAAAGLIGAFYPLRVVFVLYMRPQRRRPDNLAIDPWGRVAVVLAAAAVLLLGLWPQPILSWLASATAALW